MAQTRHAVGCDALLRTALGPDAERLARSALVELERRRVEPTPEHFRLFYLYASGGVPALNADLDRDPATRDVPPAKLARLVRRYLGPSNEFGSLRSLSHQIAVHLDAIEAELETVRHRLEGTAGDVDGSARAMSTRSAPHRHELAPEHVHIEVGTGHAEPAPTEGAADLRGGLLDAVRRCGHGRLVLLLAAFDRLADAGGSHRRAIGDLLVDGVVAHLDATSPVAAAHVLRADDAGFAVLLEGCDTADGLRVAEDVREHIASSRTTLARDRRVIYCLTASIGLAELAPGETAASLHGRAAAALRQAQAAGRNRVHLSTMLPVERNELH